MRRRVPERRGAARRAPPHGEPRGRRLVPDPLQRAPRAVRVHAAAAALRRALGARALDRRARTPRRRPRRRARSVTVESRVAAPAAARHERRPRSWSRDLPAPARPGARRSPTRARLVPYLARARRQPPLPLAGAAGAPRLDARLRRRRPAHGVSDELGGEPSCARSARRARAGWARCSTSSRTTWRPIDAEPLLARPGAARALLRRRPRRPAATAASSTSTSWPACAVEEPEVFETTHRLVLDLVAEGLVDGLRDRPPRRARGPPRVSRAAARSRASSGSGSRRSSSRASGCATGRSRGRRATTS